MTYPYGPARAFHDSSKSLWQRLQVAVTVSIVVPDDAQKATSDLPLKTNAGDGASHSVAHCLPPRVD
jgi:hypothetical protein